MAALSESVKGGDPEDQHFLGHRGEGSGLTQKYNGGGRGFLLKVRVGTEA